MAKLKEEGYEITFKEDLYADKGKPL